MSPGRFSAADSRHAANPSPPAPLRLALSDAGEERRRASLYCDLLRRADVDLSGQGHPMAAPPLQRGRMVPERSDGHTLRRLLGRALRLAVRLVSPLPTGEG